MSGHPTGSGYNYDQQSQHGQQQQGGYGYQGQQQPGYPGYPQGYPQGYPAQQYQQYPQQTQQSGYQPAAPYYPPENTQQAAEHFTSTFSATPQTSSSSSNKRRRDTTTKAPAASSSSSKRRKADDDAALMPPPRAPAAADDDLPQDVPVYIPQPNSSGKLKNLRSCMLCSIILSSNEFRTYGCPNCEEILGLKGSGDRIASCTSALFDGMIALIDPQNSWVAKWQRTANNVKGMYAIRVRGRVPEDVIGSLKRRGIRYIPRDGSQSF